MAIATTTPIHPLLAKFILYLRVDASEIPCFLFAPVLAGSRPVIPRVPPLPSAKRWRYA